MRDCRTTCCVQLTHLRRRLMGCCAPPGTRWPWFGWWLPDQQLQQPELEWVGMSHSSYLRPREGHPCLHTPTSPGKMVENEQHAAHCRRLDHEVTTATAHAHTGQLLCLRLGMAPTLVQLTKGWTSPTHMWSNNTCAPYGRLFVQNSSN